MISESRSPNNLSKQDKAFNFVNRCWRVFGNSLDNEFIFPMSTDLGATNVIEYDIEKVGSLYFQEEGVGIVITNNDGGPSLSNETDFGLDYTLTLQLMTRRYFSLTSLNEYK